MMSAWRRSLVQASNVSSSHEFIQEIHLTDSYGVKWKFKSPCRIVAPPQ